MAASRAPAAAAATDGGMEENAMAILDSCGIKDSHDLHEDRAAFLEAVRSACFAADSPSAPSWRMYDGVFQILQKCNSLDLAVASFHLLIELGKSWLPFLLGNGAVSSEIGGNARSSDHLFDPAKFLLLVEMMVEPSNAADDENGIKAAKNMMILQYLVNTLEADFVPRHVAYKAKDAVEDSIPSGGEAKSASDIDSSLNYSSLESERTLVSLRKLFVMVMKLDSIRKEADTLGLTSRADGVRNPIMEVILDELTYNISYLSPFLLAFVEWKWKLEIILQYFSKYCGKGPVRTRRSDNSQQDLKLDSVLSSFLTATSAKGIVKKMGAEVAQLLLSHAYQVCLSVQDDSSDSTATSEKIGATLGEISGNLIFAFQNLSKVSPNIPISPFEKQALFTAATLTRKLKKVGR
ncbi:hypothetical protein BS78_K298300 [Paspalum vaginatum]|uniref:Uncharacterized protein n=1 Tax=Paspalum vaginatum TaxID=158149 RepID=A0A9W8CEU7_9POAL|nr:hypothetical protein BS78_K298300 [Paspalum vaginatum]